MPEMQYNTGELRTGATHAQHASDAADQAAGALKSTGAGGSPFGDVNGGDALHAAVGQAKEHHSIGADTAAKNLESHSVRASGTAALGDDNEAETTRLAPRSANASSVAQGM